MVKSGESENKRGGMKLRFMVEKLQLKGFWLSKRLRNYNADDDDEEEEEEEDEKESAGFNAEVPADVKEGHFAVFAVKDGERRRFIVELSYLTNPEFLSLLNKAEEEFGLKQEGALVLPCPPHHLQTILEGRTELGFHAAGCGHDVFATR
ncbi:PREDICTED: uncharacterized protein LOC104595419 [Nelumbo nucifera]|uniref:Uncharacterized protein n=2 Tax=Nelumbo nucifera TaxID=4432 RepID=A0A822XYU5_NELNU|nr:PREDICTED: uncharacterized protein LOC104595419 [Nelumbo nucifera]DAD26804.1 TPA_asm: hypothetical protein HUJ06_028272 [Nelumbo nucifera]